MKVNKAQCIAFLVALGFTKAETWDDDKLRTRVGMIPTRVDEADVPKEFEDLYQQINSAPEGEAVEWLGEKGSKAKKAKKDPAPKPTKAKPTKAAAKPKKAAPKKAPSKPTSKPKKVAKGKTPAKAAKPAKGAAKAKKAAPKKAAAKKTAKKTAKPKDNIERDAFGCRKGTIFASVNAALTKDWKDQHEIAKECGVPVRKIRNRLYHMLRDGQVEVQKVLAFRLAK